jgi:hypothetical protein
MTRRALALLVLVLALPGSAVAQDTLPPDHPPVDDPSPPVAAPPLAEGQDELPPGHPAVPPGQDMSGMGDPGQRNLPPVLQPPVQPRTIPTSDVPVGSVRVTVVDERDRPVADAAVDIGGLAAGERTRQNARTGSDGTHTFSGLATGSGQAYRVNVPFGGATYSTMPFNLPTDQGIEVRITRLPVTHDDRYVFFHVFRVVVEQRGERMHVIHQTELTNAGSETYAFPAAGLRVALPEGATAFQFQRVVTDQRIEEEEDEHRYVMRGSVPPGTVRLAFAYDIPMAGGDMRIPVEIPLRFFGLQVIAEALPELGMDVRGMPRADRLDTQGQPCQDSLQSPGCAWVTHVQRGPEDERISNISVRLTGIPGPSPIRWFAVIFASLFVLGGAAFGLSRPSTAPTDRKARRRRRAQLLDEARGLEEERAEGDIGPEYHRKRREGIERELAALLYAEELAKGAPAKVEGAASEPARSPGMSFGLGVLLGILLGIIGLAIVYLTKMDERTKRGALLGFAIQLLLGLGLRLLES